MSLSVNGLSRNDPIACFFLFVDGVFSTSVSQQPPPPPIHPGWQPSVLSFFCSSPIQHYPDIVLVGKGRCTEGPCSGMSTRDSTEANRQMVPGKKSLGSINIEKHRDEDKPK